MCSGKSSDPESSESVLTKRGLEGWGVNTWSSQVGEDFWHNEEDEDIYDEDDELLEKRKSPSNKIIALPAIGIDSTLDLVTAAYRSAPTFLRWMANQGGQLKPVAYQMAKDVCTLPRIERLDPNKLLRNRVFPENGLLQWSTEHVFEINAMNKFIDTCISGILPSGAVAKTQPINQFALFNAWGREADPGQLLPIGDAGNVPLTLNDRLYGILGGNAFPTPLMFLQGPLNRKKETLFLGTKMLGEARIREIIKHIEAGTRYKIGFPSDESLLEEFKQIIGTFQYMNTNLTTTIMQMVSAYALRETGFAETVYGVERMQTMWREYEADLFPFIVGTAQRNFVTVTSYAINRLARSSASAAMISKLTRELEELALQKSSLTLNFLGT